jgi:hypothetical protein
MLEPLLVHCPDPGPDSGPDSGPLTPSSCRLSCRARKSCAPRSRTDCTRSRLCCSCCLARGTRQDCCHRVGFDDVHFVTAVSASRPMELLRGVELRADDNNKYGIVIDGRSKLRGEKVFVENLSEERRAPWREPLRRKKSAVESVSPWRKGLRGENLSEERRVTWREPFHGKVLRGEKRTGETAVFKES